VELLDCLQIRPTLAVAYHDSSGSCWVGAQPITYNGPNDSLLSGANMMIQTRTLEAS